MSLKKYLLAGGLSTMLILGACGNGEEDEGSDEETSEETENTESEDDGEAEADDTEDDTSGTEDDADSGEDTDSEDDTESEDDSNDSGDDADSEEDSNDSEDDADSEDDSADAGDDSDEESSLDLDSDDEDSSIGIGGTEDLDENEEVTDEEDSDEETDEEATEGEEQSNTYVLEEEGTYNELVYYYVGDEVTRQTSVTEMDYAAIGVTNEEEARELLDEFAQEYTDTEGVEHNIEYGEDGYVETIEVNYDEADLSEVSNLEGAEFEGEETANFVSMERSEQQLLNSGYELVEGEAVSDSDSGTGSDSGSDSASEGEGSAVDVDFSNITGETLSGDETEITSMFEMNSGLAELLDNAEESDADIEEVLKPADEVTSYFSQTFMVIHAFAAGSDTPAESDVAGLNAEIDESDGVEVYSEVYDMNSGTFIPNIYANPDQLAAYDGAGWADQTGTAESEEVYYGTYSNLHEAFMETSDVIEISEDDDYYFLHNIGEEESLHEQFGNIFNVEYTGANMDEMENAVIGVVDKSSGDLIHVAYISTAPGQENPDEQLHIEIAEEIDQYGEYDDSVTVPDVEESSASEEGTEESGSTSEESSGSVEDGLSVGDSADLNDMTLTVEDVGYTDERNEFAEVDADEVIMIDLSFENNSGDAYLMGSRDIEVMVDGETAETYPVGDIILDETEDGESTSGSLAYAVTGDPSEIELVFSPLDTEDSAVFDINPE